MTVVGIRGNLDTRLRKLRETDIDGLILAAAGIKRLIGEEAITEYFEVDKMVPAPGQGRWGLKSAKMMTECANFLNAINNVDAELAVATERAVLDRLGGGCQVPIGVHASSRIVSWALLEWLQIAMGNSGLLQKRSDLPNKLFACREFGNSLLSQGARELLSEDDDE